jgi:hypothetical protein
MADLQRTTGTGNEDQIDLQDQDISAIVDKVNQGITGDDLPDKSIYSEKLRVLRGGLAFYIGSVASGSWGQMTIFLDYVATTVATSTTAYQQLQEPILTTSQFDLFVNPPVVTPTTPNLSSALYANAVPFPQSNAGVGTGGYLIAGVGGGGGGVNVNDQIVYSWNQSNFLTSAQLTYDPATLQRYVFAVYNQTGATATFYASATFALVGQAVFS